MQEVYVVFKGTGANRYITNIYLTQAEADTRVKELNKDNDKQDAYYDKYPISKVQLSTDRDNYKYFYIELNSIGSVIVVKEYTSKVQICSKILNEDHDISTIFKCIAVSDYMDQAILMARNMRSKALKERFNIK